MSILISNHLKTVPPIAHSYITGMVKDKTQSLHKLTGSVSSGSSYVCPTGVKVCAIRCILFFLTWIPSCVGEIFLLFCGRTYPEETRHGILDATYFVVLLSSCLNPFLYAYYRKDFRSTLCFSCTVRAHGDDCMEMTSVTQRKMTT